MGEYIKVCKTSDLPSGQGMVVEINGRPLALFHAGGQFYALDNVCPHRGGPLGEGYCDPNNLTVQCPWHGWTFSLPTGISPVNAHARVEKFEVKVEGDEVFVEID